MARQIYLSFHIYFQILSYQRNPVVIFLKIFAYFKRGLFIWTGSIFLCNLLIPLFKRVKNSHPQNFSSVEAVPQGLSELLSSLRQISQADSHRNVAEPGVSHLATHLPSLVLFFVLSLLRQTSLPLNLLRKMQGMALLLKSSLIPDTKLSLCFPEASYL